MFAFRLLGGIQLIQKSPKRYGRELSELPKGMNLLDLTEFCKIYVIKLFSWISLRFMPFGSSEGDRILNRK